MKFALDPLANNEKQRKLMQFNAQITFNKLPCHGCTVEGPINYEVVSGDTFCPLCLLFYSYI